MFHIYWTLYDIAVECKFQVVGHFICAYHKSEQKLDTLKLSSIQAFCFYDISMHECLCKRTCS